MRLRIAICDESTRRIECDSKKVGGFFSQGLVPNPADYRKRGRELKRWGEPLGESR